MVDPMEFITKDIPGYEGLYQISTDGTVMSLRRGRPVKPSSNGNGYLGIVLSKDGVHKRFLLHRLYAQAFCPNPDNLPIVMHLDNVKTHISLDNLVWGTPKENYDQALRDGLIKNPKVCDRREYYAIIQDGKPVRYCFGQREVMAAIEYETYYATKRMIQRHGKVRYGPYKGCYIEKVDVQRSSLDEGVEP